MKRSIMKGFFETRSFLDNGIAWFDTLCELRDQGVNVKEVAHDFTIMYIPKVVTKTESNIISDILEYLIENSNFISTLDIIKFDDMGVMLLGLENLKD